MPLILQWTNSDTNELESFQLDVVTSLEHDDVVTITDHPVEEGANIVDHARDEPERLSIEGVITNTPHAGNLNDDDSYTDQPLTFSVPVLTSGATQDLPLDVPSPPIRPTVDSLVSAGLGALSTAISGGPVATMNSPASRRQQSVTVKIPQPATPRDRAREAYERLLGAKNGRELVVVDTGMRAYFDMLIERIAVPRERADGSTVRFQIDLRRLTIAESQTVQAPKPAMPRAQKPKNLGSQTAETPDPQKEEVVKESDLYKAFMASDGGG